MNNPKKWYEKSWPYFLGALLLSALQIITLLMTSNPWGITGSFPKLGAGFVELFGGNPSGWNAFSDYKGSFSPAYLMTNDPTLVRNLGLIFGALLSALLASQFKIKKIKSFKFALFAAMGGFLMGYGANIASGCNIGAFYSSLSSLSLSGWFFGLAMFVGVFLGGKLLLRFLL